MFRWNDEIVEQLKSLWGTGLSATEIAEQIGAPSKNAVCGKVHRLRLGVAKTTVEHKQSLRRRRKRRDALKKAAEQRAREVPAEPVAEAAQGADVARVSFHDLEAHHCRWPVGDPKEAGFGFCGAAPALGQPYCRHHVERGTQEPMGRFSDRAMRPPREYVRRVSLTRRRALHLVE